VPGGARSVAVTMKTLLKLALASALIAVLAKWARQSTADSRSSADNATKDWEPDAAEPLRGENLSVESPMTH
jgi:hypothetical protein